MSELLKAQILRTGGEVSKKTGDGGLPRALPHGVLVPEGVYTARTTWRRAARAPPACGSPAPSRRTGRGAGGSRRPLAHPRFDSRAEHLINRHHVGPN